MLNYRAGRYLWQLPGQECKCHLDVIIKLGSWVQLKKKKANLHQDHSKNIVNWVFFSTTKNLLCEWKLLPQNIDARNS